MKPAYAVPRMAAISAIPWNGYRVVSTFSGCGGSSLGFRLAGFRTAWASEFIDVARASYEANNPATPVDGRDIREVAAADILKATGLAVGDLDVLEGSPPCASFSTAGNRAAGWGGKRAYSGKSQRVDDLFFEYVRLVRDLQPRSFVAENVSGLIRGVAVGYFKRIASALEGAGYTVGTRMLDAQWLGVPQVRKRVIFVGVRRDLDRPPAWPKPLPYSYSIEDALREPLALPAADVRAASMAPYAVGAEWRRLPPGGQSDRYFSLVRAAPSRPCPTITAKAHDSSAASVAHPHECRKFIPAELLRLSGFPDDFVLRGTFEERCERIGRAVPPPMMAAVARVLRDEVLTPAAGIGKERTA